MRRRQFLASGTALLSVAVAGCGHPSVVLDMDDATAADIADEVSMSPDPESTEYTVASEAIENSSATRRGRHELFDQIDTVRIDDAFYEVSETALESSDVTVYEVRIDFDPDDSTAEIGEIAYEELPAVDRQRLDPIISDDDPPSGDGYDVGVGYGTAEEVGNGSVFVPEQQYDIIVHDGDRYRVTVSTRTTTETEYRYEATEVASGVDSFADQIRDQYLFTLTGLSEAEREVVEEAIDGGYFQDDEAFRSVTDRIREHEGIEVTDSYGTWLLAYEQVEYLTYVE
ncbi:hypothetical protein [Haloarcula argentinensis]|uniref:Uncharacterized protein n=1 Tax=Haloarcula argentinensis TaxID=43776 RepID=A0A830FKP2_HALAR|nr:hypothetical protein [Haloarcula argentinensis]EMA22305.1 hypothetical protein C443_10132 [Haloarcula argentinensis DSM 12282]MDS0252383.1 hypothetical protein [Haloarcula argentinensis]GGM32748.1 hypothetical protein GCM10009006_12860 [Haloarcula argentinensis]